MAYDPQIEYCQGMNYLTAMLLMEMDNEEDAFWCLIYIMHDLNWRSIFDDKNPKIALLLRDLETNLRENN